MKTFQLNIVTPVGHVLDKEVTFVSVPAKEGWLGVMADHMPIVTVLKSGEMLVRHDGRETAYTIGSGVLEVNADHQVLILADKAEEIKGR